MACLLIPRLRVHRSLGAKAHAEWRIALLAAMAVEVAAGLPAAAITLRTTPGDEAMILFTTCMITVGLVDMVVMPSWVWRRGAPAMSSVLLRGVLLAITVLVAACTAAAVAFAGIVTWLAIIPGVAEVGFVACVAAAGAVAGLGAWLADLWVDGVVNPQSGAVRGRRSSHVVAGAVGSLVVLGAAGLVAWRTAPLAGIFRPLPWPFCVLAPAALAMGGGLHHVLLARDAWRAGIGAPPARPVVVRAAVVCGACLAIAGGVLVLA